MAKKVYAIKEGYDSNSNKLIKNKIVGTWAECLKYVKGVKGAKYKSFENMDDAKAYLEDTNTLLKKGRDEYPEDCLHIYVDGSYNISTQRYSYGLVVVNDNVVEYMESGAHDSKSNIRQIAGELDGAVNGVEYALKKGAKKVVLFHDYEGIFHHATGSWDRKDASSTEYYEKMNLLFSKGIEVIFVKVDSHTGDFFNELADESCKKRLGIDSDKVVEKWLKKNKLSVANEEVKAKVLELINNYEENVIVLGSKDNLKFEGEKEIINIKSEIISKIDTLSEKQQLELLDYIKRIINEK